MNKIKTLLFFILPTLCFSQNDTSIKNSTKKDSTNNLKVYLLTDINYASSASDNREQSQSATGTLGVRFEVYNNLYASSTFTVHSQNQEISTDDILEEKLFGTNLLLPQNSSSDISNFELVAGVNSFYRFFNDFFDSEFKKRKSDIFLKTLGFQAQFRTNNTIWQKQNVQLPITIASLNADFRFRMLDVEMMETNERIKLIVGVGYTNRRLGGNYGLNQNSDLRKEFLGTDRLSFDGFKFSTRLEISKFYGQFDLTTFGKKHDIAGFSGDQCIISVGLRADLPISTKVKKYIE